MNALVATGVAAAGALLVALSQWIRLGSPFITPYASHIRKTGVNDQSLVQYQLGWLGRNFSETFITGPSTGVRVDVDPLFAVSPFLLLVQSGSPW